MSIIERVKSSKLLARFSFGVGILALVSLIGFGTVAAQQDPTTGAGYSGSTTNNTSVNVTNNNPQTSTSGSVTVTGGSDGKSGSTSNSSTSDISVVVSSY